MGRPSKLEVKKINRNSRGGWGVNNSDIPLVVIGLQQHSHFKLDLLVTAASVEVNRSKIYLTKVMFGVKFLKITQGCANDPERVHCRWHVFSQNFCSQGYPIEKQNQPSH